MRRSSVVRVARLGLAAAALLLAGGALFNVAAMSRPTPTPAPKVDRTAQRMIDDGRHVFRQDTFGDESFWTGVLQLNRAIAGAKHGGVGGGVPPKTALGVGLRVASTGLPKSVVKAIKAGRVTLNAPATTLALLKLNAVIGVRGHV